MFLAKLFAIFILCLPLHNAHGAEPGGPTPAAGYEALTEALGVAVRYEVEAKDLPAFSIAIVEGDHVVWADGFGFQDAAHKQPVTAETVYRVGSVSKLFTDMAVMQLVEQGRLDLDAPVQEILPDFAPHNPFNVPITLRQLMSHRAGLIRECPIGNYFDPTEPSIHETIASLNNTTLVFKPGTRTKYSNSGITVVGAALEARAGKPYSAQIEEMILRPLGMSESNFVRTPAVDEKLTTAFMWTYDGRRFEAPKFKFGIAPAGNLYSSVLDLSRFLVMLLHDGRGPDGPIIKPETLQEMTTPLKEADGKPQTFGIGFHVGELDGQRSIGHNGAVYGFSTQLEALPDRNIGVAAASALDGSNGVAGRLADYALRLLLARQDGKPLPEYPRTVPVPPERARPLVGTYRNDQRLSQVTELNGRLYLKRGVFRYELRASAADGEVLADDVINYGMTVKQNEAGDLIVGDTTYDRLADEPPADVPGHWKGLIGEYGWDHNTLYILEDRGQMFALIEWFYYYPLTELGPDQFAFPDYGLYHDEELRFSRDADGQATQVVAADVTFPRRAIGTRDGETFQIKPVRPIAELREIALAASPPPEAGTFRKPDLVELTTLDPSIKLDVRYATTNNFTGARFYKQARAFMQRPAAEALVRAHQSLANRGLGLLIHDAYRPWHVTKMFWDATPDEFKDFVANPANGSRHNRGCAVDLTVYDLATGNPIQMVAGYDEFSPRSFPAYPGGTSRQRWYRDLLRSTMEAEGFTVYEFEWWHFDYKDWKQYRIGNVTFEEIGDR